MASFVDFLDGQRALGFPVLSFAGEGQLFGLALLDRARDYPPAADLTLAHFLGQLTKNQDRRQRPQSQEKYSKILQPIPTNPPPH